MKEQRTGGDRRQSRRSEQTRLRSIVERMADGILIVGLDGVIRFANPAAERLFGRTTSELTSSEFGLPTIDGDTTEIDVVRPGGETIAVELRVVDTDWETTPARLVSLRDVTDRKRAEERAGLLDRERVARAEAEAASQAKSEFLAVMSHELRTPLNAVIGYSELLDLGIAGPLTGEQRHQIARIRASGRHLLGLVNEVLDLAKVEAGRLSLHIDTARVGQTADAALALVQPAAEARAITISSHCLGEASALYEGDEDRVRQILVNLLTNAVKFTEPGGSVTIEAGVAKRPESDARRFGGPCAYVRVSDTGIGIPPQQIATIFDPFVQVDRGHTRSNDGSGLGLTISRRLARLMKGDLTVRSTPGEGSTFTLWLPAAIALGDAAPASAGPGEGALHLRGLAEVGEALARETLPLLDAFVARLRAEPIVPAAESLKDAQLADHAATFVSDVSAVLIAIEETRGAPSSLIADGTQIQRFLAERHGAQRGRLGWTLDALRREWRMLDAEIEHAIRRRAGAGVVPAATLVEAITIVHRLVEEAEDASCRALTRTLQEQAPSQPSG